MSIQYLPLSRSKHEIRLLELQPSAGPHHARIPSCRLLHSGLLQEPEEPEEEEEASSYSYSPPPSYKALSYAWGNPARTRVILVDDAAIRIPRNLYDALVALRPARKQRLLVWADYLCINQGDDAEKAWQVALMGDIYSRADEVLAWLGPGDDASRRAFAYLDVLGREAYLCGFHHDLHIADLLWQRLAILYSSRPAGFPVSCVPWFAVLGAVLGRLVPPSTPFDVVIRLARLYHEINGWNGEGKHFFPVLDMKSVLERPWFGRVWVLQEIALARKATFICGDARIDRARLAAAVNAYKAYHQSLWGVFPQSLLGGPRNNNNNNKGNRAGDDRWLLARYHVDIYRHLFFRATMMVNAPRALYVGHFPLIALLRLTCVGSSNLQKHGPHHLDSGDRRDKIFALLGLASDRKDLGKRGVEPDYTRSYREVYALATAAMIQQGHVSVLSFVQPTRGEPHRNLPSWVPDWSQSLTPPLQVVYDDHVILQPEFSASGANYSTPMPKVNYDAANMNRISWEGYFCDTVHSVGFFPDRESSWDVPILETFSWPEEWLVEILRLTYEIEGNFPSFKQRLHAVARASVGGVRDNLHGQYTRVGGNIFHEAARLLRRGIRRIKDRRIEVEARKFLVESGIDHGFDAAKTAFMQIRATSLDDL